MKINLLLWQGCCCWGLSKLMLITVADESAMTSFLTKKLELGPASSHLASWYKRSIMVMMVLSYYSKSFQQSHGACRHVLVYQAKNLLRLKN